MSAFKTLKLAAGRKKELAQIKSPIQDFYLFRQVFIFVNNLFFIRDFHVTISK